MFTHKNNHGEQNDALTFKVKGQGHSANVLKSCYLVNVLSWKVNYVDPPVGWGSTYCFTDVGVSVGVGVGVSVGVGVHVTPITKRTPAQIPRALAFDFCYDLDLCSQGQAVRAFFIKMGFSLILLKVQGGFWSNVSESFIDRWHMTWLLLTFSWPTFASTV